MKQILLLSLFTLVFSSGFSQIDNLLDFNNDFDGDFNDHSSYGLIPTVVGDVQLATDRFGRENNCAYFDGDSYLNFGTPDHLRDNGSFSVSLWYKGASDWKSDYEILFGRYEFVVRIRELNRINVSGAWDDEDWPDQTEWRHVVGVFKSGDIDSSFIYKNGVLVAEDAFEASKYDTSGVFIGKDFEGYIDDINVFEGIVTQEEVTAFYTAQSSLVSSKKIISNEINIFPNPATNNITLGKPTNVKISDLLGNQVGNYTNVSTVDITGYSKGMYIIKFDDGTSQRFVKK